MSKIQEIRIKAGMTQKELSEKSGVYLRQIQKVESGETSAGSMAAKNLIAIADALNVHPRELLNGDELPDSKDSGPEEIPMTYIPLAVYARQHGIDPSDARQMARRGSFKTARKAGGRDWFISPDEFYPDRRRKKQK